MLTAVHHSVTEKQNEFQRLAFGHIDALYSTALRMTRNELDAEDLTQDVYVRAYRFFIGLKRILISKHGSSKF